MDRGWRSSCASADGTLVAVGNLSGDVTVYRLRAESSLQGTIANVGAREAEEAFGRMFEEVYVAKGGRGNAARSLCFVELGDDAGICLAAGFDDGFISVWDHTGGSGWKERALFSGHTGIVRSVAALPPAHGAGGRRLASASDDGAIKVWAIGASGDARDAVRGTTLVSEPGKGYTTVAYVNMSSESGGKSEVTLAAATSDGTVEGWECDGGGGGGSWSKMGSEDLTGEGKAGGVARVWFWEGLCAVGRGERIDVWKRNSGAWSHHLSVTTRMRLIRGGSFGPKGETMAASDADGKVAVWSMRSQMSAKHPLFVISGGCRDGCWSVSLVSTAMGGALAIAACGDGKLRAIGGARSEQEEMEVERDEGVGSCPPPPEMVLGIKTSGFEALDHDGSWKHVSKVIKFEGSKVLLTLQPGESEPASGTREVWVDVAGVRSRSVPFTADAEPEVGQYVLARIRRTALPDLFVDGEVVGLPGENSCAAVGPGEEAGSMADNRRKFSVMLLHGGDYEGMVVGVEAVDMWHVNFPGPPIEALRYACSEGAHKETQQQGSARSPANHAVEDAAVGDGEEQSKDDAKPQTENEPKRARRMSEILDGWVEASEEEVVSLKRALAKRYPGLPPDFKVLSSTKVLVDIKGGARQKITVVPGGEGGEDEELGLVGCTWAEWFQTLRELRSISTAAAEDVHALTMDYSRQVVPGDLQNAQALSPHAARLKTCKQPTIAAHLLRKRGRDGGAATGQLTFWGEQGKWWPPFCDHLFADQWDAAIASTTPHSSSSQGKTGQSNGPALVSGSPKHTDAGSPSASRKAGGDGPASGNGGAHARVRDWGGGLNRDELAKRVAMGVARCKNASIVLKHAKGKMAGAGVKTSEGGRRGLRDPGAVGRFAELAGMKQRPSKVVPSGGNEGVSETGRPARKGAGEKGKEWLVAMKIRARAKDEKDQRMAAEAEEAAKLDRGEGKRVINAVARWKVPKRVASGGASAAAAAAAGGGGKAISPAPSPQPKKTTPAATPKHVAAEIGGHTPTSASSGGSPGGKRMTAAKRNYGWNGGRRRRKTAKKQGSSSTGESPGKDGGGGQGVDEGMVDWKTEGNEWIGKRIMREVTIGEDTRPQPGNVIGWLSAEESDFIDPETNAPAPLWHAQYDDGDSEDLEEHEVQEAVHAHVNFVRREKKREKKLAEAAAAAAAAAAKTKKTSPGKRLADNDDAGGGRPSKKATPPASAAGKGASPKISSGKKQQPGEDKASGGSAAASKEGEGVATVKWTGTLKGAFKAVEALLDCLDVSWFKKPNKKQTSRDTERALWSVEGRKTWVGQMKECTDVHGVARMLLFLEEKLGWQAMSPQWVKERRNWVEKLRSADKLADLHSAVECFRSHVAPHAGAPRSQHAGSAGGEEEGESSGYESGEVSAARVWSGSGGSKNQAGASKVVTTQASRVMQKFKHLKAGQRMGVIASGGVRVKRKAERVDEPGGAAGKKKVKGGVTLGTPVEVLISSSWVQGKVIARKGGGSYHITIPGGTPQSPNKQTKVMQIPGPNVRLVG